MKINNSTGANDGSSMIATNADNAFRLQLHEQEISNGAIQDIGPGEQDMASHSDGTVGPAESNGSSSGISKK